MASYGYQYGTSAKKLEPEVKTPNKKSPRKNNNSMKKNKSKNVKSKKNQDKIKAKEARLARTNFVVVMVIALGSILLLMYRNVKIRESFAGVQELSKSLSSIEKENSQIAVQIQNNLNLSDIEQKAMATLGMQKLSSQQTYYINLDTKDYTEVAQKSITKPLKTNLFSKIIGAIVNFF